METTIQEEIDPQKQEAEELLNAARRYTIMSQENFDRTWSRIRTTAQAIARTADVTLDRLDRSEVITGLIFEKTNLSGVLTRIQSGERVKQDELIRALRNFVEQREQGERIGDMRHTTGSIVKLTSAASATTIHMHHEGKDDTVHASDWLYTRVIDWLQRSGIVIESARSADAAAAATAE